MIEILDEDGNALPSPDPGSDVANLIYLLEYGRKRGFRIGPVVTVGIVTAQVLDVRQARILAEETGARPPAMDSDMAIVLGLDADTADGDR